MSGRNDQGMKLYGVTKKYIRRSNRRFVWSFWIW